MIAYRSVHNSTIYISLMWKDMYGGVLYWTAIIPNFFASADLLSYILLHLMFFFLLFVTFLAEVSIYSVPQSSKSVITGFLSRVYSVGWQIIDQTRLSSNTPCTPRVPSNTAILCNNYISLLSDCVHVYTWKKWHRKWSRSSSVTGSEVPHETSNWLKKRQTDGCTAQCKMLPFCVKTITRVTQFWASLSR